VSKVLRIVGIAVSAGALAAAAGPKVTSAIAGTLALLPIPGIQQAAQAIAAISGVIDAVTAQPPPARGGVSQVVIEVEPPRPYAMGEGYVGGVRRYDRAYGGTVDDIPNPYRAIVDVYCGHGPIDSISPRFDYGVPDASYYSGFLYTSTQLGACPESSALALNWSGAPGWGASAKLSGNAAIAWNFKFDKDGKKFAAGIPVMGAYGKWVKVYDPRLDSTFPGGSGSHRLGTESTYAWSENPALHFATYAYGRYQNGKLVMGVGLPTDAIDWPAIAAWANVCDANGWTIFGRVFEPGDRWANLKDIAVAGSAEPVFSGARLSVRYDAPEVALATITRADLADGDYSTTKMQPYAARINTVVPKCIDPGSNWELVSLEPIAISSLVTADGEARRQEYPFNLVKNANQAAELATYRILNSREEGPIELVLKPEWRGIRPGECYHVTLEELGLDSDVIVLKREIDPQTFTVKVTLRSETASKHATALAATGTPPGAVSGTMNSIDRDALISRLVLPPGYVAGVIGTSYVIDADPLDGLLQALPTSITIETHSRVYSDKVVSVTGATLTTEDDGTTAIAASTLYHVYYDDSARAGGAVTLKATRTSTAAANSASAPYRHYVGSITTPASGVTTPVTGGGAVPGGWDRNDFR
jgi:hypothetical protein